MNKSLGRKQRIKNKDWAEIFEKIENLVSRAELDKRIQKTVEEIKKKTEGKKAAFAWSGGKDSLVLGKVSQMAGIRPCVLVICDLEYQTFIEWVEVHKPPELEIINTGQDIRWLAAHPNMLFPRDSKTAAKWFNVVQHKGQAKYYKEHELDIMLLGRRKVDGNYVGKRGNIYTNKTGMTIYNPLSDWSHEEILAFIHYYRMQLPPIYDWKNGYLCGTHPWAARQWTDSLENGWKEIFEIERSIVEKAAEYFKEAKEVINVSITA